MLPQELSIACFGQQSYRASRPGRRPRTMPAYFAVCLEQFVHSQVRTTPIESQVARKAPQDASKDAQKLKTRTRLQNQSQKPGATRTKNTRYAIEMVKVDLIRASQCYFTRFPVADVQMGLPLLGRSIWPPARLRGAAAARTNRRSAQRWRRRWTNPIHCRDPNRAARNVAWPAPPSHH